MNKYAIVKKGNHQYFLEEGDILEIPRLKAEEGKEYTFSEVLALGTDKNFLLGTPFVENASVTVFIVKHVKGDKKQGFKYKAKSRYRKTWGYRNLTTRIRVVSVNEPGSKTKKAETKKQNTKTETKTSTKSVSEASNKKDIKTQAKAKKD